MLYVENSNQHYYEKNTTGVIEINSKTLYLWNYLKLLNNLDLFEILIFMKAKVQKS